MRTLISTVPVVPAVTITLSPVAVVGEPLKIVQVATAPARGTTLS